MRYDRISFLNFLIWRNMMRLNRLLGTLGLFSILGLIGCSQVQVQELTTEQGSDEVYVLSEFRDGPATQFESHSLRQQADVLCPSGYAILSRQALANEPLAMHQADCTGSSCAHQLTWRIRCGNIPREPFRFFGRTD